MACMHARRCVSQMVLARVSNVKSGWKSMLMVFTTAANDESPMIVRLAFDTVEKIVREHFDYITETEVPCCRGPARSDVYPREPIRVAGSICPCPLIIRLCSYGSAEGRLYHTRQKSAGTPYWRCMRDKATCTVCGLIHARPEACRQTVTSRGSSDACICCVQVTTFTDCVNCLIAFTNNPHSLDVSLNAIAFLRFCAMKLAEGAIGARST